MSQWSMLMKHCLVHHVVKSQKDGHHVSMRHQRGGLPLRKQSRIGGGNLHQKR
jgi:hypothetical protein